MAVEQPGDVNGLCVAGADLRTHQFKFVVVSADFTVNLNGVNGGTVLGVLQDKPNTGEPANVMVSGVSKVKLGGTVALNGRVMSNASGLGIASTTGLAVRGIALEAGVSGDIISVQLLLGHHV